MLNYTVKKKKKNYNIYNMLPKNCLIKLEKVQKYNTASTILLGSNKIL